MKKIMQSQRGSTTLLAVSAVVIVTLLFCAALSLVHANINQSRHSRDSIQAQYAAEAGIKRFMVCYDQGKSATWNWLGTGKRNKLAANYDASYTVVIMDQNGSTVVKKPDGTEIENIDQLTAGKYIIQSTGTANRKSRVVKREIKVLDTCPDYASYSSGSATYFTSTIVIGAPVGSFAKTDTDDSFIGEKKDEPKFSQAYWTDIQKIIEAKEKEAHVQTSLPTEGILSGTYVVQAWSVNGKQFKTDENGAEIYVKGTLNIEKTTLEGDLLLVASNGYVSDHSVLNKAVMITSTLSVNSSTIKGGLLSTGTISVNNSELTYDKALMNFFHIPKDYGKIFYSSTDPDATIETNKEIEFGKWSK